MKKVLTMCPYCGVGCSFYLNVKNGNVTGVTPWPKDPVSEGKPCIKGMGSWETVYSPDRITKPMIRLGKKLVPVSYKQAYEHIYNNLKDITPDEIAFYGSSPCTNEDNYLLAKFANDVFKCRNLDSCARLCHATTCYAFYQAFGITAMPSRIDDFKRADCILIMGSNPAATYPVAFQQKIMAAKKKGAKLICVKDWKDETAQQADLYVEVKAGTEMAFLNALMYELHEMKAIKLPTGMLENVEKYTLDHVKNICTMCYWNEKDVKKVAKLIAKSKKFALGFGMTLTQHTYGVYNVLAAINLVIAKHGKIISMRGKANIQGVGDMGMLPKKGGDTISGSIFLNPVKALWIMESNPAQSMPDLNHVHKVLKKTFLVLHTTYPNETMKFADVVLPSCAWAERSGSFTNAESRVRYVEKAVEHMGDSKPNWVMLKEIAAYFGKKYNYKTHLDVFKEITQKVPGYQFMDADKLIKHKSQWVHRPVEFEHYHPVEFEEVEEPTSKKYPFILSTKRWKYMFCTGEMSIRQSTLKKLQPESLCLISVEDAKSLKIKDNNLVEIKSRAGRIKVKAKVTDDVPKGLVLVPFHYGKVLVNKLIPLEFGPIVEEPNLKRIAVNIKKVK
ncbi:molybdopterin-dependent oxidoreductase [Candidatus Woesearchaeota archaeon]|nr:molybdopterin-dependent oxidoreductase [Candidatus Woesearchaeota archaeon]